MADMKAIVILGPTAGGKSALAVALAEKSGGQVIGADSMQVYCHMDAGTAKPTAAQRARVGHHLIDIVEPTERFTVADWLKRATEKIDQLQHQGITPIVVGGTNLYIQALLEGMFDGPPADAGFRAALADVPLGQLHQRLADADPQAAGQIHPNDRKRLVRALEVYELTGRPISQWQTQWTGATGNPASPADARHSAGYRAKHFQLIALDWPVEAINRRINLRVKAMFYPHKVEPTIADQIVPNGESLIDEVKRLTETLLLGPQARQALGYKQVIEYLRGHTTVEQAFERTKILTRRFAKTQRTWLRRFLSLNHLEAADKSTSDLADEASRIVNV